MENQKVKKNTQTQAGYSYRSGIHTWDKRVEYHKCKKCNKIFESRHDYRYSLNKWVKAIECTYCGFKDQLTQSLWRRFKEREHG